MKDKEEQIEEMKDIVHNLWDKLNQDAITTDDIIDALYNANCRIVKKDSVVLSREEICELKYQSEEDFSKAYDLGSKEMTEKIFKMLISKLDSNQFLSGKRIIMEVDVENLAKQFDVEIEG